MCLIAKVINMINNLKNGRSPGKYKITTELIKQSCPEARKVTKQL